jgi:hypothetical protein
MLSLLNNRTFCGYFAIIYNTNVFKCVKDRDDEDFKNYLLNPYFEEAVNSTELTETEKDEILNTLSLEAMTANLTIKRLTINDSLNIEDTYLESYRELYNKVYINVIKSSRDNFQEFLFVMEYNPKSGNSHVYTFKLIDALTQCIKNKFTYDISKDNIDLIRKKYDIEIKLLKFSMEDK